ncbi:hypothetical protein UPYG_G00151860 [Umbra pygmaea]|uniref:Uncharacterized protein n=1 Tax=Umbra pygmaea TaxID=75934 RepID=A0ABD0WXK5_UMBPY
MSCSAFGCTTRHSKGSAVQFFRLPSDDARLTQWLRKMRRDTRKWNPENARLCSSHFEEDQFFTDKQGKRRLKDTAVPTIFNFTPPKKGRKRATRTKFVRMTVEDIPSVPVPHPFSMPEDSSDDDCDLFRDSVSANGSHSVELGGECLECGEQFKSSRELTEHFDSCTRKVSTSCNICQVNFSRTTLLAKHLVNAHPISVLRCQNCQRYFRSLWELNKHIGRHLFTNLLNTNPEEISSNGLNGSDEILKRQYTITSAVSLDHDCNSNDGLSGIEVSLQGRDTLPSTVMVKHEENLNNSFNVGEGILNGQYTLPLTVAFNHDYNSNDCLSGSKVSLKGHDTLISPVKLEQEDKSNNNLNGSEVVLDGKNTLPSAITFKHGDESYGGILMGQNTLPLALALDHDYNSNYRLPGSEVTLNGHYSLPSAITLKYRDESSGSLKGSKESLNRQYSLPTSALSLDHNYSSNYSIGVSEVSLDQEDSLPFTGMIKLEDQSDNGLNGSEAILHGQHTLPSAVTLKHKDNSGNGLSSREVGFDHTYSINSSVGKGRPMLEAEELENEDIKPDPSTLTLLLRDRDKSEEELEVDGAPLHWNELMSDETECECIEETECVWGTDSDGKTEGSVETDITEEDISLSEEKEMKSVYGDNCRSDIQSNQDDEDADPLKDQDEVSSGSECGSDFNPDELSDSGSCSSGCSESSYTSPVRTRNAKSRPPQTELRPSKQSETKPHHCVYCATGSHHQGLTCTKCRVLFQNRKALQNHKCLVHGHSLTVCAACGRGPFIKMDLHLRRCSGVGSVECLKCNVKFPSEKSLANHNIQSHNDPSKTSDDSCAYCGNGPFPSLFDHMMTCSKQEGLKCFVCNIFFPTQPALAVHTVCSHNNQCQVPSINTQTHDGKGIPVDCEGGPFSSLDIRTWSKRKYSQCSVCKFFYPGGALTNHMSSSHGTISQFQGPVTVAANQTTCSHCGIGAFTNLDYHLKMCCPNNCIQCSICNVSFSVDVLADHMISVHSAERVCDKAISQCSACNVYYSKEDNLVNHMVMAHTDMMGNQAGGSPGPHLPLLPMDVSLTSGHQSPCSPALTCSSSGVKELKWPAPVPVAGQGLGFVDQLSFAGQSTMSLPRVMLSSTTSSSSVTQPAGPVKATLVFDTTGGPGKIPRLVPVVQQINPPKLNLLSPTQTNTSHPPGLFFMLVQQEIHQSKSVHQLSARATAPAYRLFFAPNMNPVKSTIPPATRLVSASSLGQITMSQLSPFSNPAPARSPSVTLPPNPAPLSILFMFVNRSKQLALEKRMTMNWRSKGTYTCRQCGAISRQPSLSVKHRYLHRGSRQYHCHCGRSFLRRMHLLRHYVQHAQATRYICTACGETFDGARCLTQHMVVADNTTRCPRDSVHLKQRKGCRVPFSCHCGQLFCRPAAFLWHKLQNSRRT